MSASMPCRRTWWSTCPPRSWARKWPAGGSAAVTMSSWWRRRLVSFQAPQPTAMQHTNVSSASSMERRAFLSRILILGRIPAARVASDAMRGKAGRAGRLERAGRAGSPSRPSPRPRSLSNVPEICGASRFGSKAGRAGRPYRPRLAEPAISATADVLDVPKMRVGMRRGEKAGRAGRPYRLSYGAQKYGQSSAEATRPARTGFRRR